MYGDGDNNYYARIQIDLLILRRNKLLFFGISHLFKDCIKRDITYFWDSQYDDDKLMDCDHDCDEDNKWCLILGFEWNENNYID